MQAGQASQISVLAELERIGWSYDWAEADHVKCRCPFHEHQSEPGHKTLTCSVRTDNGSFKCFASATCGRKGDFITFLAGALRVERGVIWVDLCKRYDIEDVKIVDPDVVERWHQAIWQAQPLLNELHKRGVTDEDVRRYRLGADGARVTIPVLNVSGSYVNVRKYLPGAPGSDKMKNLRGRGKLRLYPIEQLRFDEVFLTGGEVKAIPCARLLNPHGIGSLTATGGEGNWDHRLTPDFTGKRVYICLDIDLEGREAATARAAALHSVASWVGVVDLPLDPDRFPHGDVNDYIVQDGADLLKLVRETEQWDPPVKQALVRDAPIEVPLSRATHASVAGQRIQFKAMVSAVDQSPYVLPQNVATRCDRSQAYCGVCTIFASKRDADGTTRVSIDAESSAMLAMAGSSAQGLRDSLHEAIGVPNRCPVVEYDVESHWHAEHVRLDPSLDISNRDTDRTMVEGLCVDASCDLNETYVMTGRMYPHPRSQTATLLVSESAATQDALSSYKTTNAERLDFFRPEEWTKDSVSKRLNRVYDDFESNVTRIMQRQRLHLAVDLAYHSPLTIRFDGRAVKGWVEVLVVGDSSQGKSETTLNLMRHYGLGEKVEMKNVTPAGLLGGLQKFGERWMVTWGIIPTHDGRLVVLEEIKGASVEVLAKLTDMRSSGIAELSKIEKRRRHARTRLIGTSNPRGDRRMSSYSFGVEAVVELMGAPEDLRRFDYVLTVSEDEIDPRVINELQRDRPVVEHTHTDDLCRELILWTWTRRDHQVEFDEDATKLVISEAIRLCERFTPAVPILDRGSTRLKLARLAASLAARTFSTDDSREVLIVRPCHVEYVAWMLDDTYSTRSFGYLEYSQAVGVAQDMRDPDALKKRIEATSYPRDLCQNMLYADCVDVNDFMDWCGWDRSEAQDLLGMFVRKRALQRDGRTYRKTPQFVEMLKLMLSNGHLVDRPDFIPEPEEF